MTTTWRVRVHLAIFRWLWGQLRHEGTRQWVLKVSLEWLWDFLVQSPNEGLPLWLEVFQEARHRRWLGLCQTMLDAIRPLRLPKDIVTLSWYCRARLDHWQGKVRQAEKSYHAVLNSGHVNAYLQAHAIEGLGEL